MNVSPTSNRVPQFVRDMFYQVLMHYNTGSDPFYTVLTDEFGEENIRSGELLRKWTVMSDKERALWLTGVLWNDRGIMPGALCREFELREGSSYSKGARQLRQYLTKHKSN